MQALAEGRVAFVATGDPEAVAGGALTLEAVRKVLAEVVEADADDPRLLGTPNGLRAVPARPTPSGCRCPDNLHPDSATHRLDRRAVRGRSATDVARAATRGAAAVRRRWRVSRSEDRADGQAVLRLRWRTPGPRISPENAEGIFRRFRFDEATGNGAGARDLPDDRGAPRRRAFLCGRQPARSHLPGRAAAARTRLTKRRG